LGGNIKKRNSVLLIWGASYLIEQLLGKLNPPLLHCITLYCIKNTRWLYKCV